MITDSIKSNKKLVQSDTVVKSLINLRDELYNRHDDSTIAREMFFKINSCLYKTYGDNHEQK